MTTADKKLLNAVFLENRLNEFGLKYWWVAEQIGVDRKTLTRWLNGNVKSIQRHNLESLARCLQCQPEDLVLVDEVALLASKADQETAAELIVQDNLLATLTPSGQWPLLEAIVKTTMQPNLQLATLGKLYNMLSICSWRQDKVQKAKAYAERALQIGEGIGHRGVIAQAKLNLATVESFNGRLDLSIPLFEEVISTETYIDSVRTVAAALSNIGNDYLSYGDFQKSRVCQERSVKIYESLGLSLNLGIAMMGIGLLELQVDDLSAAEKAFLLAQHHNRAAKYLRGQAVVKIYLADCKARSGDFNSARELITEGTKEFALLLPPAEALNEEILARFYRLQASWHEAKVAAEVGLSAARDFPLETAALNIELAFIYEGLGDSQKARRCRQQALDIYKQSGALLRWQRLSASLN